MKNIFYAAVVLFLTTTAQAATVSFNPLGSNASLSDIFSVDIVGGDSFPETQGGGVNLFFDKTVINALSVSIDPIVWDFVNDTGTIDNGTGQVSDIVVSAFPGVATGSFIVATVTFEAIGPGLSSLTLTESTLNPWATGGNLVNPSFVNGSVNVAVVPLPGALGLFVAGLMTLVRTRRIRCCR